MKSKLTGAAGLAAAFVAGMVVATALGGGMAAVRAKTQGQQIAVQTVMSPTVTDADIALLRKDIRAMKMQVIGENMSLSDSEAQKFWPIYKHYADDLHEVHNAKYALFKQYAETWATMTDQDALIYVRRSMEADAEAQALRLKYVPVMNQILPGKKAATFFQLERRLCLMIDLQLFSQIPLAHAKGSDNVSFDGEDVSSCHSILCCTYSGDLLCPRIARSPLELRRQGGSKTLGLAGSRVRHVQDGPQPVSDRHPPAEARRPSRAQVRIQGSSAQHC